VLKIHEILAFYNLDVASILYENKCFDIIDYDESGIEVGQETKRVTTIIAL